MPGAQPARRPSDWPLELSVLAWQPVLIALLVTPFIPLVPVVPATSEPRPCSPAIGYQGRPSSATTPILACLQALTSQHLTLCGTTPGIQASPNSPASTPQRLALGMSVCFMFTNPCYVRRRLVRIQPIGMWRGLLLQPALGGCGRRGCGCWRRRWQQRRRRRVPAGEGARRARRGAGVGDSRALGQTRARHSPVKSPGWGAEEAGVTATSQRQGGVKVPC